MNTPRPATTHGLRVAPEGTGEAQRDLPGSQFLRTVPVGVDVELPVDGLGGQAPAVDLLLHDLTLPAG